MNKTEKWDKEIHFYDKLNGHDLEEHIVRKRLKSGLKSTICVYMMYDVYENLTKHNSSFIQDCEMLIGYKSLKERQDRLNELKKKWQS